MSAPFTGDNTGNKDAWAYLDNVPSWTARTWTLAGSTTSQLTQMEFGYGVEPCANTMFMDFGGTSGNAISLAQLASGTARLAGGSVVDKWDTCRPDLSDFGIATVTESDRQIVRWWKLYGLEHDGAAVFDCA